MHLIIIPFHDWRKSEKEGFRTRDVHFIKAFETLDNIEKILVVNRPYTSLELKFKKHKSDLQGEVVFRNSKFSITKVSEKIYVLDYESLDITGQFIYRHKWFFKKYGEKKLMLFISKAQEILGITNPAVLCQNIFAYKFLLNIEAEKKIFDAWDNFSKFPAYSHIKPEIESAYTQLSEKVQTWITNSKENQLYFKEHLGVNKVHLIKNGVNEKFAEACTKLPEDMEKIPGSIIGFGGKISYLLDTELINYLVEDNPALHFVFVGQVLDKSVFDRINKTDNVHFLGDKTYDIYPCYVNHFDVGIIPYRINENQHGGDSIKAYEYLQAGKTVIGTCGNGLTELSDYLYLAENKFEFSEYLKSDLAAKRYFYAADFSWESKAKRIQSLMNT